jgi:hypothetical protein
MKGLPAADWLNYQTGFVPTNNRHTTVLGIHVALEDRQQFTDWFVETMPDMNHKKSAACTLPNPQHSCSFFI